MAGVGFDHQPDVASGVQLKRVASGERQMNFDFDPAIDAGAYDYVTLLEGSKSSRNDVAGAQPHGRNNGQKNIPGADSDAQLRAHLGPHQGSLQFELGVFDAV